MQTETGKEAIEKYVGQILHKALRLQDSNAQNSLPAYLGSAYALSEGDFSGRRTMFMARRETQGTPAEMAKHVALVQEKLGAPTVLVLDSLPPTSRARLIEMAVPFIVPGNQMYLPFLAVDLREHFRAPKVRPEGKLTPAAQALLFYHLLGFARVGMTSSDLAEHLAYTPMSIGRALDELAALNLARTERRGRERHILFTKAGKALFDEAKEMLRSPVKTRHFIDQDADAFGLKIAGEAALSRLSSLNHPERRSYACTGPQWSSLKAQHRITEVAESECHTIVEIWAYDPSVLSETWTVDALSLYAQFWKDTDERVAMAAEDLLGTLNW
jgi:DNA-binding MarR family transcriptional regulator